MKTKLSLIALLALYCSTFAAAPDSITIPVSTQDKLGLEHVTAQFNAEAKTKHDQQEAKKPEAQRVAYVPITEEQYAKIRVADVFKSWTALYTKYRMELPENVEFFKKATTLPENVKDQIKALIEAGSSQ